MATFTRKQTWAHNTNNADEIGTVKGGSTTEYLISITLKMGTGKGTFTHSSGGSTVGHGNAIRIRLKISEATDPKLYSDVVSVTHQSEPKSNGSTNVNDLAEYTFIFPTPVKLEANTTYNIWYSDYGQESNNVICCSKAYISGVTAQGAVKIYDGTSWKTAIPWVHDGTSWKTAIPWVNNGTSWKVST